MSTQPFAVGILAELRQQLPDQILHLSILYLAHRRSRRRVGAVARRRAVRRPREPGERAARRRHLGGARSPRNPRDFDAAWKLARADYWLGGHAPGAGTARVSRAGHRRRPQGDRARAEPARRPLLDRREHGRARRVVRPARRASSTASRSRRSSRPCCGSIRRSCRARPTARSAAGISRCPAVRRQQQAGRSSTCASR